MTNKATLWRGNKQAARQQQATIQQALVMIDEYKSSPWVKPQHVVRQELKELLAEVDPYAIQTTLDLQTWDLIGGAQPDTGNERNRAVRASKWLFKYNPLAQWSIWLWTAWGMGDKVRVSVPDNEAANEAVDEFFTADRNAKILGDDRIKELSRWLLVKGNRFFMFMTSTVDGASTIRLIDQDEMTPLYNPHDKTDVWFYKRTWTPQDVASTQRVAYYPDWTTYFAERSPETPDINTRWEILEKAKVVTNKNADKKWDTEQDIGDGEKMPRTDAYIMWTQHNIKDEDSQWGWPILTNPRAWLQAHQHLMESRLTVAEAKSQFVRRKQVTGGSRAVKSVINTVKSNLSLSQSQYYDTNPPPVAGATEVENAMVDTTDLPMVTGAGDTATDNKTFTWMALLGAGLFPTSAGLDTARFATALEMDKAQSMLFEEYKRFWAAQFKKIAKIVLMALEKWGNQDFGKYVIVVSIDTFSLADFPVIAKTIGGFVRDTVTPMVEKGVIGRDAAMAIVARFYKMALDSLGIEDAADLTSNEAFEIGVEREEPTPTEPEETPEEIAALERQLIELKERHIIAEQARRDTTIEQALAAIESAARSIEQDEPEQPQAVTVNVPEQPINVTVETSPVTLNLPDQEPPIINVEGTTVEAAQIEVTVPPTPAPQIIVNPPPQPPAPEVTVNVAAPETPGITIEATLKPADETLETETIVDRNPVTDRITKTTKTTRSVGGE